MRHLIPQLARRLRAHFYARRLQRHAAWLDVPVTDPELVGYLTDAMVNGSTVQINYEDSGWRVINPYGWNTSKAGNMLIMCYKDTGEIRSYRLDRVLAVNLDSESPAGAAYQQHQQEGLDLPAEDVGTPVVEPSAADLQPGPFAEQVETLTAPPSEPTVPQQEEAS